MDKYDPERVAVLSDQILRHKRLYYAGKAEISDSAYDKLEDELRELQPAHPVLTLVGSEVPISTGRKVQHGLPMLSLDKTYVKEDLWDWSKGRPLVGLPKIDGVAISLIFRAGTVTLAKTRGNGLIGEDATDKIRWVAGCNPKLPAEVPAEFEVRGELYCTTQNFALLLHEMESLGLERPTSPRNIVAGVLGRKQHGELARFFSFMPFDVIVPQGNLPFVTEMEKVQWLRKVGFAVLYGERLTTQSDVYGYIAKSKRWLEDDNLGIDGAVFTLDDLTLHTELGATSHHPRYRISFKWQGATAVARVISLKWATSRFGIVTPVAIIEPVYLSGAEITNITLHNAAYVRLFNIKPGDRIEVVRSGEVIPKFLKVVESAPGNHVFPTECPSCRATLTYDEVRLQCSNRKDCPAQELRLILNWIRCAEIDDLSEKRLIALMELGLVQQIADLYALTLEDLLRLPLTKEKMATKLFHNIERSKVLPLASFLNGLGIKGMGKTSWDDLLAVYPALDKVRELTQDEIVAIPGFAAKTAEQVVTGLRQKRKDIDRLLRAGVLPQAHSTRKRVDSPWAGKSFVITGTMTRPRKDIVEFIEAAGAKVADSVSANTFAVVIADPTSTSSKATRARDLGIPLWSEVELFAKLR